MHHVVWLYLDVHDKVCVCSLGNMSSCSSGTHTHTLARSISTQDGLSALDYAKQQNHPQVCEILEKHGAKQTGPGSQVLA